MNRANLSTFDVNMFFSMPTYVYWSIKRKLCFLVKSEISHTRHVLPTKSFWYFTWYIGEFSQRSTKRTPKKILDRAQDDSVLCRSVPVPCRRNTEHVWSWSRIELQQL